MLPMQALATGYCRQVITNRRMGIDRLETSHTTCESIHKDRCCSDDDHDFLMVKIVKIVTLLAPARRRCCRLPLLGMLIPLPRGQTLLPYQSPLRRSDLFQAWLLSCMGLSLVRLAPLADASAFMSRPVPQRPGAFGQQSLAVGRLPTSFPQMSSLLNTTFSREAAL